MAAQLQARVQEEKESNGISPWLGMIAIFFVAIDLRPGIVAVGPVLNSIREAFGLSHAMASLLTAIPDVLMGSLALPTPWLAKRFGRDKSILAALVLLCLSIVLRSYSTSTSGLLLTTIGVGAGIAVAGALVAGFIKANFANRAALVMGVYGTALSIGSTISAGATGLLAGATSHGWRFGTGAWSVLGLSAIASWVIISKREPSTRKNQLQAKQAIPLPWANKTAWLVAAYFAINNLIFYAMVAWIAPLFHELGYSSSRAGLILASFTAAFTLGNPIFGSLSRHHDRRTWLAVCSTLAVAGLAGIAISPASLPFVFIPLAAVGMGGGFTLGMTLPLDNTKSVEEANVWNAFTLMIGYLVAASGPILVGVIRDKTGTFEPSLWGLFGTATVGLFLTPLMAPRKILEEEETLRAQVSALENEL